MLESVERIERSSWHWKIQVGPDSLRYLGYKLIRAINEGEASKYT